MDAKELTKRYEALRNEYNETKKKAEYMEMELGKLRMLVDDMKYDIKDLQMWRNRQK